MKVTKEQRSYRPKACTVKLIEVLAEKLGLKSQADIIDQWADEWVEKNGCPDGVGEWQWSEKKSGAAREVSSVVEDDVPDDLPKVVKVRPAKKVMIPLPDGVITAAKLAEPKKKADHLLGADGKIYINGVAQVTDLRAERLARTNAGPLLKPSQRK